MAKYDNQKLKLIYLQKIFSEETDESHGITMKQIIAKLAEYGVPASRKTIYSDIDQLRSFGLDISCEKNGNDFFYRLLSREFELAEVKMLVDSIQSARFITARKSRDLIRKLEGLVSKYQANQLQRQVTVTGMVKTDNKIVTINVDRIQNAISSNRQITFQYFNWNVDKKKILRNDGKFYSVSPWRCVWDHEKYYLIAYDNKAAQIKHYRIDKMIHVDIEDIPRDGKKEFSSLDLAAYSKSLFGMFGGEQTHVTLEGISEMAAVIIDHFGTDVNIAANGDDYFIAVIDVVPSNQFLGWVLSLGGDVWITGPKNVVENANALIDKYQRNCKEKYHANKVDVN